MLEMQTSNLRGTFYLLNRFCFGPVFLSMNCFFSMVLILNIISDKEISQILNLIYLFQPPDYYNRTSSPIGYTKCKISHADQGRHLLGCNVYRFCRQNNFIIDFG